MKQISMLKPGSQVLFNSVLNLLAGLTIGYLSTLLIYFKQKVVFHHVAILVSVFIIYFLYHTFQKGFSRIPKFFKALSLIFILLICLLGPQFIYQIRPYTFYISGLAIGGILIVAISTTILIPIQPFRNPLNFVLIVVGYLVSQFLTPILTQYFIFGGATIFVVYFVASSYTNAFIKSSVLGIYVLSMLSFWWFSTPIVYLQEQSDYEDKVLFATETQYHDLVITQWHDDHWVFIDKLKNISSIDEYLYYEPMTHGVFKVSDRIEEALVIGGENGCLIREVIKYDEVKRIDVISYDSLLRKLGMENPYFIKMNKMAFDHAYVHIIHEELLQNVYNSNKKYDAIFIDLPDPRSVETNQYYTFEFYNLIRDMLNPGGVMITQAGSPYFATDAYNSIGQTIREAGFNVLPIHNQILTLGEWGWYICSLDQHTDVLKKRLIEQKESLVETKWFNQEAATLISSFGKTYADSSDVHINTLDNPLVYQYYLKGNWNLN